MCWDFTPAGTVAYKECPDYVHGLSRSGLFLFTSQFLGVTIPQTVYGSDVR